MFNCKSTYNINSGKRSLWRLCTILYTILCTILYTILYTNCIQYCILDSTQVIASKSSIPEVDNLTLIIIYIAFILYMNMYMVLHMHIVTGFDEVKMILFSPNIYHEQWKMQMTLCYCVCEDSCCNICT